MDCNRCGSPLGWCNCPQKSWQEKLREMQINDPFDLGKRSKTTPVVLDPSEVKGDAIQSSLGWSSEYYQLPDGAEELQDLIEYREMSFAVGNIFKAAYRLGNKKGTDRAYDLRKIIWFAERELRRIEKLDED